jgi:hypothetical protein
VGKSPRGERSSPASHRSATICERTKAATSYLRSTPIIVSTIDVIIKGNGHPYGVLEIDNNIHQWPGDVLPDLRHKLN